MVVEFICGPIDGEMIKTDKIEKTYYIPYRTSYETIDKDDNYAIEWYEMIYEFKEIKYGIYKYEFRGWQ